jgi:hypothetical protein
MQNQIIMSMQQELNLACGRAAQQAPNSAVQNQHHKICLGCLKIVGE